MFVYFSNCIGASLNCFQYTLLFQISKCSSWFVLYFAWLALFACSFANMPPPPFTPKCPRRLSPDSFCFHLHATNVLMDFLPLTILIASRLPCRMELLGMLRWPTPLKTYNCSQFLKLPSSKKQLDELMLLYKERVLTSLFELLCLLLH